MLSLINSAPLLVLLLVHILSAAAVESIDHVGHEHGGDPSDHSMVHCMTTKGPLLIKVNHKWSPLGAKRFMDLVRDGFYSDIALYRCVDKFLVQFGVTDKPDKKHWSHEQIKDDPNLHLGTVSPFLRSYPS
jgi:peptidyl-prolyl cis-trans isomerase A (cyclophilin A)